MYHHLGHMTLGSGGSETLGVHRVDTVLGSRERETLYHKPSTPETREPKTETRNPKPSLFYFILGLGLSLVFFLGVGCGVWSFEFEALVLK